MKRLFVGSLIVMLFIIGIIVGSRMSSTSQDLLEQDKVIFEEEIVDENGNYVPKNRGVAGNTTTKIAQKIDQTIANAFEKAFKAVVNILTE